MVLSKFERKENAINLDKKNKYSDIKKAIKDVENEISKIIVGQREIIHGIIRAILSNGHVLVEGVPGIAKTLIIRAMAKIMGCEMKRIQFTVDLLPTDITGIQSYTPQKGFEVMKGPVFANFIIADEINRSPPKTQSALLEAMQEKCVTIARDTYNLPSPFFVMATENPLENSGVYQLPEAQVDRFLFKLLIGYPTKAEEIDILSQNITINTFESFNLKPILSAKKIIEFQEMAKDVFASDTIKRYIVDLVNETRNKNFEQSKYISYGASPRASISLFIASKAEALMNGRDFVIPEDVKNVIYPILRHRLILNYEAQADNVTPDDLIKIVLKRIEVP